MCHFAANTCRLRVAFLALALHGCLLRSGYEAFGDDSRASAGGRSSVSSGGDGPFSSGALRATAGSSISNPSGGNAGTSAFLGTTTRPSIGGTGGSAFASSITGGAVGSGGSIDTSPGFAASSGTTTNDTNATSGTSGLNLMGGARSSLGGGASGGNAIGGNRSSGGYAGVSSSGGVAGATSSGGVAGATPSGGVAGATSSGGVAGATPSGGACSWINGPPAMLTLRSVGLANTAYSEIDPVLSQDGLSLYYVRYTDAVTGNDIYVSTRASATAAFGKGTLFAQGSSTGNDTHFFVAADGLEAFVSSNRTGASGGTAPDIFGATRRLTSDPWSSFSPVPNVNSMGGDFDPHLESDGLTLWFAPIGRADGAGLQDLFYAHRGDLTAPFGAPIAATSLNTTSNEWNVSLTGDGLVIVFQSDRGASSHVYYATRSNRSQAFGAPSELAQLDQYMATLSDPFVAPNGCGIYFAATLSTGLGGADLYVLDATP
ncbi:MAG TPA: hypothetical protein VIV60_31695 [Polyangiaceae bacterium]